MKTYSQFLRENTAAKPPVTPEEALAFLLTFPLMTDIDYYVTNNKILLDASYAEYPGEIFKLLLLRPNLNWFGASIRHLLNPLPVESEQRQSLIDYFLAQLRQKIHREPGYFNKLCPELQDYYRKDFQHTGSDFGFFE